MFRRFLLASLGILVLTAASAEVKADSITISQGQIINLTLQSTQFPGVTGLVTVTLSGNQLIITLTNTSTNPSGPSIQALGFDTTPDISVSSVSFGGALTNVWQTSSFGGPGGNFEFGARSDMGNRRTTLEAGQTGTITLTLTSVPQSITFDRFLVHFIRLPNGESEWLGPNGTPEPIPELTTMVLLGTGLAGLGGAIRRRRRKVRRQQKFVH